MFKDKAINKMSITAAVAFEGDTKNMGSIRSVGDRSFFSENFTNLSEIIAEGVMTFAGDAVNKGTIISDRFLDMRENSVNEGYIEGAVRFWDQSQHKGSGGHIKGEVEFMDRASCGSKQPQIEPGQTIEDIGSTPARITGKVIFMVDSFNKGLLEVIGSIDFIHNSYNDGTVIGSPKFSDKAINKGKVVGDATFYEQSTNEGVVEGNIYEDRLIDYRLGNLIGD
jgi:hypothetical protein